MEFQALYLRFRLTEEIYKMFSFQLVLRTALQRQLVLLFCLPGDGTEAPCLGDGPAPASRELQHLHNGPCTPTHFFPKWTCLVILLYMSFEELTAANTECRWVASGAGRCKMIEKTQNLIFLKCCCIKTISSLLSR